MNRKTIIGIILLMSISLIGIIAVQVFWIKNAIAVKAEQFDRSVNDALSQVVERLEKNENLLVISDQFRQFNHTINYSFPNLDSLIEYQYVVFDSLGKRVSDFNTSNNKLNWLADDFEQKFEMYSWIDSMDSHLNLQFSTTDTFAFNEEVKNRFEKKHEIQEVNSNKVFFIPGNDDSTKIILKADSKVNLKRVELNNMVNQMLIEVETFSAPISQRLDINYLQNQIVKALNENGLQIPFEFAVVSGLGDDLIPVRSKKFENEALNSPYRVSLFPNDIFEKPDFLLLSFPDISSHLYKSIFLLMAGSVVFTLIIIITFSITIWMILRQKKISEIKSDFINNMTHEFKTPIATISLAVDSIENPKILSLPDKVKYFTGIIRDENRRMNKQVENVLQMAMVDKKDFNLQIREINAHDIIQRSANHFKLQIEKKKGNIILDLNATNPMIENDEIHFFNIINNLIDNAIKYSNENPEIKISTENSTDGIHILVKDNGIGISKEAQEKIFDKFYRVSSGNIHNVKGFGLGLSYVKAIVLTFKGTITVKSELGKGSTFEVFLPCAQPPEAQ